MRIALALIALAVLARPVRAYDPFRHEQYAAYATLGTSGATAISAAIMAARGSDTARAAARMVLRYSFFDAVGAGAVLYVNATERSRGLSPGAKTDAFRQELLTGMLFDFVYLSVGIVLAQHGSTVDRRERGWRYLSRAAYGLGFGAVNYGISVR